MSEDLRSVKRPRLEENEKLQNAGNPISTDVAHISGDVTVPVEPELYETTTQTLANEFTDACILAPRKPYEDIVAVVGQFLEEYLHLDNLEVYFPETRVLAHHNVD